MNESPGQEKELQHHRNPTKSYAYCSSCSGLINILSYVFCSKFWNWSLIITFNDMVFRYVSVLSLLIVIIDYLSTFLTYLWKVSYLPNLTIRNILLRFCGGEGEKEISCKLITVLEMLSFWTYFSLFFLKAKPQGNFQFWEELKFRQWWEVKHRFAA